MGEDWSGVPMGSADVDSVTRYHNVNAGTSSHDRDLFGFSTWSMGPTDRPNDGRSVVIPLLLLVSRERAMSCCRFLQVI